MSKIIKNAVIRSNEINICPFGLSISCACRTVGDLIIKMAPLDILGEDSTDEERLEIANANNNLFLLEKLNQKCPFVANLFKDKPDFVNCNWDPEISDIPRGGIPTGSPYFYKHFLNTGLYAWPLSMYTDSPQPRHLGGPYSIEGIASFKDKKK